MKLWELSLFKTLGTTVYPLTLKRKNNPIRIANHGNIKIFIGDSPSASLGWRIDPGQVMTGSSAYGIFYINFMEVDNIKNVCVDIWEN